MADRCKNDFLDELKAMKERMEDLFLRNFNFGTDADREQTPQRSEDWIPMCDIVDTGSELVYVLDLPGVLEEDLHVECKDDRLWVSGVRAEKVPRGESLHSERPQGGFSRVFRFPCPVAEEMIAAEFKKGVLRITVPKSSASRTQRVVVREAD